MLTIIYRAKTIWIRSRNYNLGGKLLALDLGSIW